MQFIVNIYSNETYTKSYKSGYMAERQVDIIKKLAENLFYTILSAIITIKYIGA